MRGFGGVKGMREEEGMRGLRGEMIQGARELGG